VDPDVNQLAGVFLYDIDSLQAVAMQSLALRRQQIASAEAIIAEHVSEFWQRFIDGGNSGGACAADSRASLGPSLHASES
jgi:glutamyl-tRNA reductase